MLRSLYRGVGAAVLVAGSSVPGLSFPGRLLLDPARLGSVRAADYTAVEQSAEGEIHPDSARPCGAIIVSIDGPGERT